MKKWRCYLKNIDGYRRILCTTVTFIYKQNFFKLLTMSYLLTSTLVSKVSVHFCN